MVYSKFAKRVNLILNVLTPQNNNNNKDRRKLWEMMDRFVALMVVVSRVSLIHKLSLYTLNM